MAAARALRALDATISLAIGVLLAALLAVVAAGVAARYLLGAGLLGSDELALWLFTAVVFGGLPLVAGSAVAMRLDLLVQRLGGRARRSATVLAEAVVAHAALVLLSGGLTVVERLGGTSTTLGLPEWLRFAPLLAGAGIALLAGVLRAAADSRPLDGLAALALGAALYGAGHSQVPLALGSPSLAVGAIALAWLAAGAPLPHALLSALALAIPFGALLPEAAIVQTTAAGLGKTLLLAVPLFVLASVLMLAGGLADRIVRLAASLVGHRRGGLAKTTLLTNLLFSGVSGSSIADAAFGATVLAPGLRAAGYTPPRAAAIVASTAVLPNIIPPSIAFLLLAHAANLSAGALFTGGFIAGLVVAAVLAVTLHLLGGVERGGRAPATAAERRAALVGALPALGLALVVVAGIRLGVTTPTEAAAVAAIYALAAALVLGGPVRASFARAARETAAIGLLIGSAAPLTFLLAVDGMPAAVAQLVAGLGVFGVLTVATVVLLIAGCLLDIGAAILLLAPLLLPAATAAGIDPIAFGVLLVVTLMIGGITPPVGVLVYVASGLTAQPAGPVFRAALPFVAALVLALAVLSTAVGLAALHSTGSSP